MTELANLTEAERLLATARTVEDAVDLADQAEAMRVYAKKIGLGLEAQNHAAEIKIRAERRAGELLAEMEKNPGGPVRLQDATTPPPTLADLGVEKTASHRYQAIASIPEEKFEDTIAVTKEQGAETHARSPRSRWCHKPLPPQHGPRHSGRDHWGMSPLVSEARVPAPR